MPPFSRKALRLPEILFLIFEHVLPADDDPSMIDSGRHTLSIAAQVCKAFSDHALAAAMAPPRHDGVKLLSAAKLTEQDDADPEDLDNAGLHGMLVSSMIAY